MLKIFESWRWRSASAVPEAETAHPDDEGQNSERQQDLKRKEYFKEHPLVKHVPSGFSFIKEAYIDLFFGFIPAALGIFFLMLIASDRTVQFFLDLFAAGRFPRFIIPVLGWGFGLMYALVASAFYETIMQFGSLRTTYIHVSAVDILSLYPTGLCDRLRKP